MAPAAESIVYRNFPSPLVARSRLKLPDAFAPTTVEPIGVKTPVLLIENPEMFADAVFEVKTYFPFGVTRIQQVATPKVGMLEVMAVYLPFAPREYEETLPLDWATTAKPVGVNSPANASAAKLGVTTSVPRVPSPWIGNASTVFVFRSV